MKFKRKTLKVVASLVLTLLMCLSIVPVSAMAMVEGEPPAEEPVITEPVVEETQDTQAPPPVEEPPAATEPTPEPVAAPAPTAEPTPAPTYTVEYKVDGGSLKKEEGMAADTTFPAPPSGYEAYTWAYTDDSGNTQAFVWGDAAQPANIGARNWELDGTAPVDEPEDNSLDATANNVSGAQIANNARPSLGVNVQGGNPQADTRTVTFTAPVDGQQPVTTTVDLTADENGDAFVTQEVLDQGLAALNAALAPYELEVTGWDGDYVGTLVGQEGLTINATVQSTAADISQFDHVVTFYTGDTVYVQKGVNDNEAVSQPQAPPVPQGMAAFKGWYLDEAGVYEYDFTTEVTSDFSLYAVFSNTYLVQFLDAYVGVIQSQEVAGGDYATAPDTPDAPDGETFQFWYEDGDVNETPFDVENTPITSSLTLAPKFSKDHYVFFDANGGTLNSAAYMLVEDGELLEEPAEPTNTGFEFAFWSKNAEAAYDKTEEAFDFENTEIKETTTLYAIWEPQEVGYILNVWNEIANFSGDPGTNTGNYELVYTRVISPTNPGDADMLGTAGQLLNNGTSDVITEAFINDRQYEPEGAAVYDILDYSDFAWTDAGIKGKELSGTGDTVINLYAKRIEFPIKISLDDARSSNGKTTIGRDVTITTRGNGTHTAAEGTYSFTMKLDQNISQIWPATYTVNDNTGYKFVNFSGYHGLSTETSIANKAYIRAGFFANGAASVTGGTGRIDITSGPATLYGRCNPSSIKEFRYYYTEASPERVAELGGESAFFPIGSTTSVTDLSSSAQTLLNNPLGHTLVNFNGKFYEYRTRGPVDGGYQNSWNPKGWPGTSVAGFRTIVRTQNDATFNTDNYQVALSTLTATSNNGTEDEGATLVGNICYFMPRVGYTLTLITGEGATIANADEYGLTYNGTNGYTKTVPYGEEIDLTGLVVNGATPFDAWYTSDSYTNKVTTATMPDKNMTLYAAYDGQFQPVTYYSKLNGDEVDHVTVKTGGKLPNLSIYYEVGKDYEGLGVFKGWGYIYPGTTYVRAYNTNIPVTAPLDLYGMWQTANLKITYDANGGTGTAPVDSSAYKYNVLASVMDGSNLTGPGGKVFVGWQIEGTGPIYYPGATITVKNNYTLYAKYVGENDGDLWKLNYHPNYDGATQSKIEQTVLANSQVMPRGSGTFTRPGYSLIGWSTTETGPVDYSFTQAIDIDKDGIDLYAVWKQESYLTVTFNVSNDLMGYLDDAGANKSTVEREGIVKGTGFDAAVGTVPTPVAKEGYYFAGWTPKEPSRKNYQYVQSNLTFTAQFAAKTVFDLGGMTIANQEKVYSASDPANFFNNWPSNLDDEHFDIGWSRVRGEDVGTYTITVSVAPKPEFAYLYTMVGTVPSATLTIKPLALTLTATDAGKVYGESDPSPLTTVGMAYDKVQNPKADFTKDEPVYTLSRQSGEDIGKYNITVTADAAANPNYTIKTVPAIFTISAQGSPLVINMPDFTKVYGNADPTAAELAASLTVSNLVGGDTADKLGLSVTRTPGEDVGTYSYTITYDEAVAANYSGVTVNAGKLVITQRLAVLYANSYPAAGGTLYPTDARPDFTAYIDPRTPLAFDQTDLMYSLYLPGYSGTGMPGAGTYTIGFNLDPADPMNRNYYIEVVPGTLTVTAPSTPVSPEEGTPETIITPTPAPVAPVPGPGGGPAAIVTPPVAEPAGPATTPEAPTPVATTPEEAPASAQLVNLDGTDVPLATTTVGQWALVNLMVAILALVLGILMFATMFKRNKKRNETEEEKQARMAQEAARGEDPEEDVRNRKSGLLWRVLSILAGILAPIVFLVTENMNNPMVLVDHWTLLMVAIFAIQVICMLLVRYARTRKDGPEEDYATE